MIKHFQLHSKFKKMVCSQGIFMNIKIVFIIKNNFLMIR